VPLNVIVAGLLVAFRQVVSPAVPDSLLIAVFTGSEVDHVPILSGNKGQFPELEEIVENCA
jgi:hypothetical protein